MVTSLLTARCVALVWALLTSVSLLLTFSWYTGETSRGYAVSASIQQTAEELPSTAGCLEDVVTVRPGGRLGNLVLEYASAAAVARRHHMRLAVPSTIFESLNAIFENLTAEPLSLLLQQPPCRGLNLTEHKVLDDKSKQPPQQLTVDDMVTWARRRHLPVILRRYVVLTNYIASSLEFLRQEFRFRADMKSNAIAKLERIVGETAQKTGVNNTQVCAVGVHVRRTDYGLYMRSRFHLRRAAGIPYYKAASSAMLADLHIECAAVAFAVTSDDNQWCQRNLLPALTRNASEDAAASVGFLMSTASPAADMCLLSSCQHLIMDYGTFGLTAAILSGGRTTMYDTAHHGAYPVPAAQKMTSLVPHWRLVS